MVLFILVFAVIVFSQEWYEPKCKVNCKTTTVLGRCAGKERAPSTFWIEVEWTPQVVLDTVERKKFLSLPGIYLKFNITNYACIPSDTTV